MDRESSFLREVTLEQLQQEEFEGQPQPPLGPHDDALPLDVASLPAASSVLDLAYRRGETRFVREARAAGHRAADGLTMLIEQGALSFERWFGVAPDRAAMRRAVE